MNGRVKVSQFAVCSAVSADLLTSVAHLSPFIMHGSESARCICTSSHTRDSRAHVISEGLFKRRFARPNSDAKIAVALACTEAGNSLYLTLTV